MSSKKKIPSGEKASKRRLLKQPVELVDEEDSKAETNDSVSDVKAEVAEPPQSPAEQPAAKKTETYIGTGLRPTRAPARVKAVNVSHSKLLQPRGNRPATAAVVATEKEAETASVDVAAAAVSAASATTEEEPPVAPSAGESAPVSEEEPLREDEEVEPVEVAVRIKPTITKPSSAAPAKRERFVQHNHATDDKVESEKKPFGVKQEKKKEVITAQPEQGDEDEGEEEEEDDDDVETDPEGTKEVDIVSFTDDGWRRSPSSGLLSNPVNGKLFGFGIRHSWRFQGLEREASGNRFKVTQSIYVRILIKCAYPWKLLITWNDNGKIQREDLHSCFDKSILPKEQQGLFGHQKHVYYSTLLCDLHPGQTLIFQPGDSGGNLSTITNKSAVFTAHTVQFNHLKFAGAPFPPVQQQLVQQQAVQQQAVQQQAVQQQPALPATQPPQQRNGIPPTFNAPGRNTSRIPIDRNNVVAQPKQMPIQPQPNAAQQPSQQLAQHPPVPNRNRFQQPPNNDMFAHENPQQQPHSTPSFQQQQQQQSNGYNMGDTKYPPPTQQPVHHPHAHVPPHRHQPGHHPGQPGHHTGQPGQHTGQPGQRPATQGPTPTNRYGYQPPTAPPNAPTAQPIPKKQNNSQSPQPMRWQPNATTSRGGPQTPHAARPPRVVDRGAAEKPRRRRPDDDDDDE